MSDIVELTTTVETEAQAQSLAEQLVSRRLAACVQITGPIHSVYRWENKVERSQEFRCTVKTRAALTERVMEMVTQLHPYEVPEILVVQVAASSDAYAAWLRAQVDAGVSQVEPDGSK